MYSKTASANYGEQKVFEQAAKRSPYFRNGSVEEVMLNHLIEKLSFSFDTKFTKFD